MQLWELFVIAVGLSMDAFAVSICKGLSVQRLRWSHALTAGAWFGAFQALMPLAGWLLGTRFEGIITSVDHWVAFVLLVLIGGNMVKESRGACEALDASFAVRAMLPLAVATSIDALAVGLRRSVRLEIRRGRHVDRHRQRHPGKLAGLVGAGPAHARDDAPPGRVHDARVLRRAVPVQGGAVRRCGAHRHGGEDPAGAPGGFGINKGPDAQRPAPCF